MPEPYRQILNFLLPVVTGLTTTGASVFESVADAIDAGSLPALVVQPREENVSTRYESPDDSQDLEDRTLGVELITLSNTVASRDASALEVKTAVMQSSIGTQRRYEGSRFEERKDGERITYAIVQRFEFHYDVESTNPSIIRG